MGSFIILHYTRINFFLRSNSISRIQTSRFQYLLNCLSTIKTLFVENLGHLAVNSGKLGIVTICAEGVSAVEGVLIALEGHGGFAVVVVGAPQKVVGQQANARRMAMTVSRCLMVQKYKIFLKVISLLTLKM